MQIKLPKAVEIAINKLKGAGHEAYIVGGCVRDALRGEEPHDYDMTTSALPEETKAIFSEYRIIETGMKHGTVTALIDSEPLEITTFRVDGAYTDHRRPEEVTFTRSLREDVARRDFTVNAMAYSPDTGVMDFWGGREDLEKGVIRAVGEPDRRFNEDALRIMRAMRFASVLDFEIDGATSDSMIRNRGLLRNISAERINAELSKLLLGDGCERILTDYAVILTEIIPELAPAIERMLASDEAYVLNVMVPHDVHVLPMIPGGMGYRDVVLERIAGDGKGRKASELGKEIPSAL